MRQRYIAVRVESDQTVEERDFYDAIWASILRLFGEYGASQTEFGLVEFNPEKSQAILRCSHKALDLVKASTVGVTEIGNGKATVHVLLVSGTLKSLRRKLPGRRKG